MGYQTDICTLKFIGALFTISKMLKQFMSIGELMDKKNVVYTLYKILFNHKKGGNSDTCYNMDEPWGLMLSEISQSQKTNTVWLHLYEVLRVIKSWKQKIEWWLPGAERQGEWGDIA